MALLKPESLQGLRLGLSVSESTDLARLGLLERHFRLALGELARSVIVSGGELVYGGYLRPGGYGDYLSRELHRFGRRDRPFHCVLAWSEHRQLSLSAIAAYRNELALYGDLIGVDPNGDPIDMTINRQEAPQPETNPEIVSDSLSALRRFLTRSCDGRILLGGRKSGYQGEMPGVVEECISAIEAGQPIYLAGGFGGVTADLAGILVAGGERWLPELAEDVAEPRYAAAVERIVSLAAEGASLNNGLSPDENRCLATSHRPSEIAALVSLGMGRRFANQN